MLHYIVTWYTPRMSLCVLWLSLLAVSLVSSALAETGNLHHAATAAATTNEAGDTPPQPMLHPIQEEMLPFVEDMFVHAMDAYLTHAFPKDDLKGMTGGATDSYGGLSITLIDSLDTVALLGRPKLFRRLAKWVEEHVNFDKDVVVSVFETNIRVVGGLLSAHFMYEEGIVPVVPEEHPYDGGLLRLAVDLGDRLLRAFHTPTGIPYGSINLRHGVMPDETTSTATAGGGTYLMEMTVLSRVTGDPKYEAAARRASQALFEMRTVATGLLGNHINISNGEWIYAAASVGTGADSILEYWVKGHALSGEAGEWEHFELLRRASSRFLRQSGFYSTVYMHQPSFAPSFTGPFHCSLASFYPGCLVHGGHAAEAVESVWSVHTIFKYFGAVPEEFRLSQDTVLTESTGSFPLRPEHLESIYHLYRATRDPVYLKMGREFAIALHLRTRTPFGFANLGHVIFPHHRGRHADLMESFLISETLKYLYLLFDECNPLHMPSRQGNTPPGGGTPPVWCPQDAELLSRSSSQVSLVGWVFNTEAHPFPNHAEWFVPGPSSEERKPPPPGAFGGSFTYSSGSSVVEADGTAVGALSHHLDGVQERASQGDGAAITEPAATVLDTADRERRQLFTETLEEARKRNLHGLLRAMKPDHQTSLTATQGPFVDDCVTTSPKYRYYCENQALDGLDRLSKAIYRQPQRVVDY